MRNKFVLPYKYADGIYLLHSLEEVCDKHQRRLLYQKLAECYEKGIGVVKDVYKASDYYTKAKDNQKASEIVREYNKQKKQLKSRSQ